jgi:hypothetical protein
MDLASEGLTVVAKISTNTVYYLARTLAVKPSPCVDGGSTLHLNSQAS